MGDVLPPGTRLGRYEIVQRLALGGMAEIYLARASGLGGFAKHVVLKRILPSHARDPEFVRMFFNEARYAATLDHPNIAHVYDLGEEQGLHYFTMEYLHGEDCRTLLHELAVRKLKLPLEHALTIVAAAATGCHFAHEHTDEHGQPLGLVHRDVSPSNVVITYSGAVKLVDFGIAKATNLEDVTAIGTTKGKLAYMAPEQCKGTPLDRRADVYALGVLLYELTTQRRAFHGVNDAMVMWAVVAGGATPPNEIVPDYPAPLAEIVMRAMHVARDQRFATARELQQALEGFARDHQLPLSPSVLGEWLERVTGPKVEPWRTGDGGRLAEGTPGRRMTPLPAAVAPALAGHAPLHLAGEPTAAATDETSTMAASYMAPRASSVMPTPRAPSVAPIPRAPSELPTPLDPWAPRVPLATMPPPPARMATVGPPGAAGARWPGLAAAVIVAASASAAIAIIVPKLRARDAPAGGPVVLVTERGNATIEGAMIQDSGTLTGNLAVDAGVAGNAGPGVDAAVKAVTPRPPPPPVADPLSRAFARRTPAVKACVKRHAQAVVGRPEVTLRFVIDTAGVPTSVELTPEAVATTALGACVRDVARGIRFPIQRAPVAFRIVLQLVPEGPS